MPSHSPSADCQIRSNRDRKNVCLLDKRCQTHMAPLLWKSISPSFKPILQQSLLDLYNPNGNILKNVTDFTLWDIDHSLDHRERLLRFLVTMPRNQLKSFSSNYPVDDDMLHIMLQNHRTIETLRVPFIQGPGPEDLPLSSTPWIGEYFRNLKSLEINLDPDFLDADVANYSFIVANAPKLESLQIQAHYEVQERFGHVTLEDMSLSTPDTPILTKLEHLSLSLIDFDNCAELLPEIDFSKLKTLRLKFCRNIDQFLQMLLPKFEEDGYALEILEIGRTGSDEDVDTHGIAMAEITILNQFLESFVGLKELYIDADYNRLVHSRGDEDADAISTHAGTLEILCAGSANGMYRFNIAALTRILDRCTNLKQLGISFLGFAERTRTLHRRLHRRRDLNDLTANPNGMPVTCPRLVSCPPPNPPMAKGF